MKWQDISIDMSCLFHRKSEKPAQIRERAPESNTEALHRLVQRIADMIQADQDGDVLWRATHTYVVEGLAMEDPIPSVIYL